MVPHSRLCHIRNRVKSFFKETAIFNIRAFESDNTGSKIFIGHLIQVFLSCLVLLLSSICLLYHHMKANSLESDNTGSKIFILIQVFLSCLVLLLSSICLLYHHIRIKSSYFNPAKETENAFIKVREIVLIDYSLPFAILYKILSVT